MRRVRLAPIALLFGIGLVACTSEGVDDGSGSDEAIIGGVTDTTHRAVVELMMTRGDEAFGCTATFISQTVLLTAAHCVTVDGAPHTVPSDATFEVMTSTSDADAPESAYLPVRNANVHPHPAYDGYRRADVAIVVLDRPYAITPMAIQRAPFDRSAVGRKVQLVGYGKHVRGDSRSDDVTVRRTVTTTLRAIDGSMLLIGRTGQQACDGDSGGPAILDVNGVPTIIGTDDIAARDVDCVGGDYYQRVDVHLPFILPYLGG